MAQGDAPDPELGPELGDLTSLDRVIHEPGRLQIMTWLSVLDEADFLFLLEETGLTRGNLSSHVAKLEHAGYVKVEKIFVEKMPRTVYRLTDAGADAFERYRAQLLRTLEQLGPPDR